MAQKAQMTLAAVAAMYYAAGLVCGTALDDLVEDLAGEGSVASDLQDQVRRAGLDLQEAASVVRAAREFQRSLRCISGKFFVPRI